MRQIEKKVVVFSLLGTTLDRGEGKERWSAWRPNVSLCQQAEMPVSRLELLHQSDFSKLAESISSDIADVSSEVFVSKHILEYQDPWNLEQMYSALYDFARGYNFDTDREEYLVHITTGTHIAQICLFLLTEAKYFPAKLLQTAPLENEPKGRYEIIDLDLSHYDRIFSRFQKESSDALSFLKFNIGTKSPSFNMLVEQIEKISLASNDPLLLTGETGVGKTRLAGRIYELKKQRNIVSGDFVSLNCATLRGDNAMSALFGHTKGAFTGAQQSRVGLLRKADKGVLFLDEIAELGLDEQAMLLRALEEKVFLPLGSDKEVRSDFVLIAGTNADLQERVASGKFREDLLSRIDIWKFCLPCLRERIEDIAPNLEYEIEEFARRTGNSVRFSEKALSHFLSFAHSPDALWRRNFRDLNAAVIRMGTLADAGTIRVQDVEQEIERLQGFWREPEPGTRGAEVSPELLPEDLDLFDRAQLQQVISVCKKARTLSDAGRELFSFSRAKKKTANDADRLRKYLSKFGLTWEEI